MDILLNIMHSRVLTGILFTPYRSRLQTEVSNSNGSRVEILLGVQAWTSLPGCWWLLGGWESLLK